MRRRFQHRDGGVFRVPREGEDTSSRLPDSRAPLPSAPPTGGREERNLSQSFLLLSLVGGLVGCGMLASDVLGLALLGLLLLCTTMVSGLLSLVVYLNGLNFSALPGRAAGVKRFEQTFGELQIRIRPKMRCPYCHDGIAGQTYECPACKAIYHDECLEEARGCTTLGCVHQAKPRRVHL